MNDTTRRYPRTINEAFLCDARRAYAVEVYRSWSISSLIHWIASKLGVRT